MNVFTTFAVTFFQLLKCLETKQKTEREREERERERERADDSLWGHQ